MSRKSILAGALIALSLSPPVLAAAGDTVADRILGQRRFSTALPYFVDGTLLDAAGFAIDRSAEPNRVYVASPDLNRVLGWSDVGRFRAGAPADLVLGQPSIFNGVDIPSFLGCPVPSASTFCKPTRVAVDPAGNLWMIDPRGTRRILEFDAPLSSDTRADRVIEPAPADVPCRGLQPCFPLGLEVSPEGNLYVQDGTTTGLPRQVVFVRPLATDLTPDFALVPPPGPFRLDGAFDAAGGFVFVADQHVWRYPPPIGPGTAPEMVSPQLSIPFGGQPALDSRGNLYVASYTAPVPVAESFVYVIDVPFQAQVLRIGRQVETSQGLAMPDILAVDRSSSPNHLYVVDAYNRVLGWRSSEGFANGAPADLVLQGTGGTPGIPGSCFGASASQFCPDGSANRGGLAVDSRGNLWMADVDNHRVLEFDRPFASDGVADRVLGQGGSFTSRTCNLGGLSARSLCFPGALALDAEDRLYVADMANHRVLLFEHPLTDDAASRVFGQPGFTQGSCNQGRSRLGAATLCLGESRASPIPISWARRAWPWTRRGTSTWPTPKTPGC